MSVVNVNRVDNLVGEEGTLGGDWCLMGERLREQKEREMDEFEKTIGYLLTREVMEKFFSISSAAAKEKVEDDGGQDWIEWKGGECPIPWAGAYEYEVKLRSGYIGGASSAKGWVWGEFDKGSIVAYRLRDGWVPVVGGKCPIEADAVRWEIKDRDGNIFTGGYSVSVGDAVFTNKVVAIRRIPSAQAVKPVDISYSLSVPMTEGVNEAIQPLPVARNFAKEMREAVEGWGVLLRVREGDVVEVGREILATLRKDWN